jgi:thiosulfate/3-mercaptopyruvate sulfurtransferase
MMGAMRLPAPVIEASELAERLAAKRDGTREDAPAVRLLDARMEGRAAYDEGHLPGAVLADPERDLAGPVSDAARGGRHPLPELASWARRLGEWGIGPETPVVVYDDTGGLKAAARAWWMLRAVGHEAVAVLSGGLTAARAAGLPLETAAPAIAPKPPYPAREWCLPRADADEVERARQDPSRRVIDVRAAERFLGQSEPLDPIAGHIPGAVNAPCADNLDAEGHFKAPGVLARQLEMALGGVPPERAIVHCGSGVTACHTLLALERAGLGGAHLYVGSWSEWCRNERPRA